MGRLFSVVLGVRSGLREGTDMQVLGVLLLILRDGGRVWIPITMNIIGQLANEAGRDARCSEQDHTDMVLCHE